MRHTPASELLPSLLEVHIVAKRLSVSPEFVRRELRGGRLPGYRIANMWRVDPRELEAYQSERRTAPAERRAWPRDETPRRAVDARAPDQLIPTVRSA